MGRKIVVILLLWACHAQAQDPKFKKVEKLYLKKDFDKAIAKSLRLKTKFPKEAESYYYLSISYFGKFEKEKKPFLFKKSLQYLDTYSKREENLSNQNLERLEGIHEHLLIVIAKEKNERRKKLLVNQLADLFKDTISLYYVHNDLVDGKIKESRDIFPPGKVNRRYMLAVAENLIGVPYKYGGVDTNGFDCSGFVRYVYQQVGMKLPHNAHMISKLGEEIPREEARIGDVVVFGYRSGNSYRASHAGIVYGEGDKFTVIHCVSGGVKVAQSDWENHWSDQVLFVKRLIDE